MKQRQTLTTRQPRQVDTTDTPAATTPASKSSPIPVPARSDGDDRHALIATEAYLLAEHRGFTPGSELEDWLAAEHAVDTCFRETPAIGVS